MSQKAKFWWALVAITLVCYADFQLIGEGYASRKVSPIVRQLGHLIVFVLVTVIGYWAWAKHQLTWLKTLWLFAYVAVLIMIVVVGGLKTLNVITNYKFLDWVTTIRHFFSSPLPHMAMFMLTLLANERR